MKKGGTQKESNKTEAKVSLDIFRTHAMPKEFLGKSFGRKEASEYKMKQQMQNLQKREADFKVSKESYKEELQKKQAEMKAKQKKEKKSNYIPAILIIGGLIIFISFGILGFFILQGSESSTTIVEKDPTPIIEDVKPDKKEEIIEVPQVSIDTDSDGLTDVEEKLYGTDIHNSDTDGDTYLDGNEVFHVFDPLSIAPSSLMDTDFLLRVEGEFEGDSYSLYHPKSWKAKFSEVDENSQIFEISKDKKIIFTTHKKESEEDFLMWYNVKTEKVSEENFSKGETKNGYTIFWSENGLSAFVIFENVIYEFEYDNNDSSSIDYLQTFKMMINSFNHDA